MIGFARPDTECVLFSLVEVIDFKVEVNLLRDAPFRPRGGSEVINPLKTQGWFAHMHQIDAFHFLWCIAGPRLYCDSSQFRIEPGKLEWLGAVKGDEMEPWEIHEANVAGTPQWLAFRREHWIGWCG